MVNTLDTLELSMLLIESGIVSDVNLLDLPACYRTVMKKFYSAIFKERNSRLPILTFVAEREGLRPPMVQHTFAGDFLVWGNKTILLNDVEIDFYADEDGDMVTFSLGNHELVVYCENK